MQVYVLGKRSKFVFLFERQKNRVTSLPQLFVLRYAPDFDSIIFPFLKERVIFSLKDFSSSAVF